MRTPGRSLSVTVQPLSSIRVIHPDVGAAESIDRLLRIPHQEQLPRDWADLAPIRLFGITRGEKKKNLRL